MYNHLLSFLLFIFCFKTCTEIALERDYITDTTSTIYHTDTIYIVKNPIDTDIIEEIPKLVYVDTSAKILDSLNNKLLITSASIVLKKHKSTHFKAKYISNTGKVWEHLTDRENIKKKIKLVELTWEIDFEKQGNTLPKIHLQRRLTNKNGTVIKIDVKPSIQNDKIYFFDKQILDSLREDDIKKIEYTIIVQQDTLNIYKKITKNYTFPIN